MSSVPRPRYKRITYFCAHVFSVPSQLYVVGLSKVRHYQLGIVEAVKEPTFAGKSARRKDTRISSFDTRCFDRIHWRVFVKISRSYLGSKKSFVMGRRKQHYPKRTTDEPDKGEPRLMSNFTKKCFCLWLVIGCLRGITTLRFQTNE